MGPDFRDRHADRRTDGQTCKKTDIIIIIAIIAIIIIIMEISEAPSPRLKA